MKKALGLALAATVLVLGSCGPSDPATSTGTSTEPPISTSETDTGTSETTPHYTPTLTIGRATINATVGDTVDFMEEVSATGTKNEDVTDLVEVIHSVPMDEEKHLTSAGDYVITYRLAIEGEEAIEKTANLVVAPKALSEYIENGDFEDGTVGKWVKDDFEGSGSELAVVEQEGNHLMELSMTAIGWNQASPRLSYNDLQLINGQVYEFKFDAYALKARTMHVQIGEIIDADPWFKAAFGETYFFPITTEKATYSWRFEASTAVAGANLNNLSLTMEFGAMTNGGESEVTTVYFDNMSLRPVDKLLPDTTAPRVASVERPEYHFTGAKFDALDYVKGIDEKGEELSYSVIEEESTLPVLEGDGVIALSNAGKSFKVVYSIQDLAGNEAKDTYEFTVEKNIPVVNGFNLAEFRRGDASNLSYDDTSIGYVYSQNDEADYGFKDGVLTVTTEQNAETDPWSATQVFVRSPRVQSGATHRMQLSVDIESSVEGYFQIGYNYGYGNEAYHVLPNTKTTIGIESNYFNNNYGEMAIIFGAHPSVYQKGVNVGPATVKLSNFQYVITDANGEEGEKPDAIKPNIRLNTIPTYFVGDKFDLNSTVYVNDFRGGATLSVNEEKSSLPVTDSEGTLTQAGEYYAVWEAVDKAGNKSDFTAYYNVREPLVGSNGFCIERVINGEESQLDDPSSVIVWNDASVNVKTEVIDKNGFKVTTDQKQEENVPWYATQIWFKSLKVDTFGLYKLSYDIVSDKAGTIKLDNDTQHGYEIEAGTNHVEKEVRLTKGSFYKTSIQLGKEETGNIGPCTIEIRNLSLTLIPQPENPVWEGYGMEVTQSGTDNVITYENIPASWSEANARIYDFTCDETINALKIEFTGTKGHAYQFKFEGMSPSVQASTNIVATGERQSAIIDMRNMRDTQKQELCTILAFCTQPEQSGTLTIHGYEMFEDMADCYDTRWWDFGCDISESGTDTIINYAETPTDWWSVNAQYVFDHEVDPKNPTITFEFTGTKDHVYLFKIEGGGYSYEKDVVATGGKDTFVLDYGEAIKEENRSKLKQCTWFCKSSGLAGSITIHSVTY